MDFPILNAVQQRLADAIEEAICDTARAESALAGGEVSLGDIITVLQVLEGNLQLKMQDACDKAYRSGLPDEDEDLNGGRA